MSGPELGELLSDGERHYQSLLGEATELLHKFDILSAEEVEASDQRRRELMGLIQKFDLALSGYLHETAGRLDPSSKERIDNFICIRETLTRKILEIDSLVIAFARERLTTLKDDLAALAKGKSAIRGYDHGSFAASVRLDQTA